MNFDDKPAEAEFRSEARASLDANGPVKLRSTLNNVSFGAAILETPPMIAAAKAWQQGC
jgi:hypothetical protein